MEATLNNNTAPAGMRWSPLSGKFVPNVKDSKKTQDIEAISIELAVQRIACLTKLKEDGKINDVQFGKMQDKILALVKTPSTTPVVKESRSFAPNIKSLILVAVSVAFSGYFFSLKPETKAPTDTKKPITIEKAIVAAKAVELPKTYAVEETPSEKVTPLNLAEVSPPSQEIIPLRYTKTNADDGFLHKTGTGGVVYQKASTKLVPTYSYEDAKRLEEQERLHPKAPTYTPAKEVYTKTDQYEKEYPDTRPTNVGTMSGRILSANQVEVIKAGMSANTVVRLIGLPESNNTSSRQDYKGNMETSEQWVYKGGEFLKDHYVYIINGKVNSVSTSR